MEDHMEDRGQIVLLASANRLLMLVLIRDALAE